MIMWWKQFVLYTSKNISPRPSDFFFIWEGGAYPPPPGNCVRQLPQLILCHLALVPLCTFFVLIDLFS